MRQTPRERMLWHFQLSQLEQLDAAISDYLEEIGIRREERRLERNIQNNYIPMAIIEHGERLYERATDRIAQTRAKLLQYAEDGFNTVELFDNVAGAFLDNLRHYQGFNDRAEHEAGFQVGEMQGELVQQQPEEEFVPPETSKD